jgi:penicillin-binding protein 1A
LPGRFHPGDRLLVQVVEVRGGQAVLRLQPQAALIALDPRSRDVLALVGGHGQRPGDASRVTQPPRPAAGVFQPLIYAAALASRRYRTDALVETGSFSVLVPRDGQMRLREALAQGAPQAAVRLLSDVGVGPVADLAQRLGIPGSQLPRNMGLASGALLTPWQAAGVYATFADTQKGRHLPPRLLPESEPERGGADLPPQVAYLMSDLLRSVVEVGIATRAQELQVPGLAGKNSTSANGRDAWFVGYHADLLAVVWVGYEGETPLRLSSTESALPLWLDFMQAARAVAPRSPPPLPRPPGLAEVALPDGSTELVPEEGPRRR